MTTPDEIRRAVSRIEGALSEFQAGFDNREAKRIIGREIDYIAARLTVQTGKLASLREWIDILYSPRKWARWGGTEKVELLARHDCASLNSIAAQLEHAEAKSALTYRERAAILAAVSAGLVTDPWVEPVHAIDQALGITSAESRGLLEGLMDRRLIWPRTRARDVEKNAGPQVECWWWEAAAGILE